LELEDVPDSNAYFSVWHLICSIH